MKLYILSHHQGHVVSYGSADGKVYLAQAQHLVQGFTLGSLFLYSIIRQSVFPLGWVVVQYRIWFGQLLEEKK